MRLLLCCLVVLLFSCHSTPTDFSTARVTVNPVPDIPKRDSVVLATQKFAYKNLEFGINEAEYKKRFSKQYEEIGIAEYYFDPLFDNNGKFYLVEITGDNLDANYFDTKVQREKDNLVDIITKKYGQPDEQGIYPRFSQMTKGYIQFTDKWVIGTKVIRVGVYSKSNYTYCAAAWIFDQNLYDQYQAYKAKKEESTKQKSTNNF